MSFSKISGALMVALLAVAPAMATTTIQNTGCASCGFQTWDTSNLNENGNPFWDHNSADGADKSIGHFLTGTGGFTGNPNSPNEAIPYYGLPIANNGGAAQNYWFHVNPINSFNGTLVIEVAGLANANIFGWYEKGDRNDRTVIFNGAASAGATAAFNPTADFGFFLQTSNGNLFFTESSLNGTSGGLNSDLAYQHFATFSSDQMTYWIGVEDSKLDVERSYIDGKKRYGDFNDMVIRFSESQVPEPSTWAMLGGGLVALGIARFRRRAS
jgi:hypothetical protein